MCKVKFMIFQPSFFEGFNEVCVDGVCQCAKYNNGDCLGPRDACPNATVTLMTCDDEIAGSVCNTDIYMCDCPTGEVQIARKCYKSSCKCDILVIKHGREVSFWKHPMIFLCPTQ